MKKQTKHIAGLIRTSVKNVDKNADVILYGSRARGEETADSDWDILILTDYQLTLNSERKFRNKLYDLELETGVSFSVFIYSKSDWQTKQRITPYYHNVIREGINL